MTCLAKHGSFAEHFGDDENQKCAAQSTAQQKVDDGISNSGKQWCDFSEHGVLGIVLKAKGGWVPEAPLCYSLG